MVNVLDKTTRKRLFRKIKERKRKLVDRVLESIDEGIDISFLVAAEETGDLFTVMPVIDHISRHGSNDDLMGHKTPLLMAVSEGFIISARLLAETITGFSDDGDVLSETDADGHTAAEIARKKGMHDVADTIEEYLRQN